MVSGYNLLGEEGWTRIDKGSIRDGIRRKRLQEMIKKYFNSCEDLSNFRRRNGSEGLGLELISSDGSQGYVFVGPIQLDRDFKSRMQNSKERYQAMNKIIKGEFVRVEDELAGFAWGDVA